LRKGKFMAERLNAVTTALINIGAVAICDSCSGKGYTPPASGFPSCKACAGAGIIPVSPKS
jgi:DnaJ-class molecular chaperone